MFLPTLAPCFGVPLAHAWLLLCAAALLTGCAEVKVSAIDPSDYFSQSAPTSSRPET